MCKSVCVCVCVCVCVQNLEGYASVKVKVSQFVRDEVRMVDDGKSEEVSYP